MATVTESVRADGRGHWPAGKRRNSASGRVEALKRLERYRIREGLSIRGAARLLSVSDRAVRRWLSGEHWPRSDLIELIRQRCVLAHASSRKR